MTMAVFSMFWLLMNPGCASHPKESAGAPGNELLGGEEKKQTSPQAISFVVPTRKHKANGIFTFTPVPQGLRIVGGLTGLASGIHALHLHDGDCSTDDSAFVSSPKLSSHPQGAVVSMKRHLGDLGNFAADANGEAKIDYTNTFLSLTGTNSVLGGSLIVYEGSDSPTNHLGERVACGVIQMKSN